MTEPQQRLLALIESAGEFAEFWPIVNDWVKDKGPAQALALRNINRTVDALVRAKRITIDDDGLFHVVR